MGQSQVVLITGALTGIGRATAIAFARAGAAVVVSGRHDDAGQALAAELRELGAEAEFARADVRYDDQLAAVADHVVGRFGRLDVAVNNAGTDGEFTPVAELTPGKYTATFDTNVLGTLLSMKHELRIMQRQRSGSIVNVSSIYGKKGFPDASLYVASKHAIIGLTRSAALEAAAYGVRVNAVGPGPVQTAMLDRVTGGDAQAKAAFLATVPLSRAGRPEEIAAAIAYVSSPEAGFLTGQTIFLDGGMTAA
jgi:NAD(P)-dependent dehydrogenase (short-subunit alcohol dehydrogenase family)